MKRDWLKPDWEPGLSIQHLPIEYLINLGIKGVLLDVDGTLLARHEVNLHNSVKLWVEKAKENLNCHLLSNNPSKRRIENISKQLNITFTYNAAKPSTKALRRAIAEFKENPQQIAIIGDRLFTDILVGNRLGLYTVLVQPLGPNGIIKANNKTQRIEQSIAALFGAKKQ